MGFSSHSRSGVDKGPGGMIGLLVRYLHQREMDKYFVEKGGRVIKIDKKVAANIKKKIKKKKTSKKK